MKNKKAFKPKKYRTTILPAFILTLKGRIDSKRGESVVEAYVQKLVHKVKINEACLYKEIEFYLSELRGNASIDLLILKEKSSFDFDCESKIAQYEKKSTEAIKKAATSNVVETCEVINHIHGIGEEQSVRIRAFNDKKLFEYFKGVKSEYRDEITYVYSDEAKEKYLSSHKLLDKTICSFAESIYNDEMGVSFNVET